MLVHTELVHAVGSKVKAYIQTVACQFLVNRFSSVFLLISNSVTMNRHYQEFARMDILTDACAVISYMAHIFVFNKVHDSGSKGSAGMVSAC